jgi:hypothetical protein
MKDYHINIIQSQEDDACIADIPDVNLIPVESLSRRRSEQRHETRGREVPVVGKRLQKS